MNILKNNNGIALVMVLVLSVICLAIMAGLIYFVTQGTKISGMEKRYKTALVASLGGADFAYQVIGKRGDLASTTILYNSLVALTPATTTPNTCITDVGNPTCTAIGSFTGLETKLKLPTVCWSGCDSSLTIDPAIATTYDLSMVLGTAPNPVYNVFAKIVDTIEGNTSIDKGLAKTGVVQSNSGEITVAQFSYLYTIEIQSEAAANLEERAKTSLLYSY